MSIGVGEDEEEEEEEDAEEESGETEEAVMAEGADAMDWSLCSAMSSSSPGRVMTYRTSFSMLARVDRNSISCAFMYLQERRTHNGAEE